MMQRTRASQLERLLAGCDAPPTPSTPSTLWLIDTDIEAQGIASELVHDIVACSENIQVVSVLHGELADPVPFDVRVAVAPLARQAAVTLLRDAVHVARPDWQWRDGELDAICTHVGGLPASLVWVARYVIALGVPATLAALTQDELRPPSLEDALRVVWDRLSNSARDLLVATSVLHASFSMEAASAVLPGAPIAEGLRELCAAQICALGEGAQFQIDAAIRGFARRQSRAAPLQDEVLGRLARYFAQVPVGVDRSAHWADVHAYRLDLMQAWSWALQHDAATCARLALRLDDALVTAGPATQHVDVLARTRSVLLDLRSAAPELDASLVVDVLCASARERGLRGRFAETARWAGEAVTRARALGDVSREARALTLAVFGARGQGKLQVGLDLARQSLALATEMGDARLIAGALQAMGLRHLSALELEAARSCFERAEALARNVGAPRLQAIARANLGLCARAEGKNEAARAAFDVAESLFTEIGDTYHLYRVRAYRLRAAAAADDAEMVSLLEDVVETGDWEGELEVRTALLEFAERRGGTSSVEARALELEAAVALTDDESWRSRVAAIVGRALQQTKSPTSITLRATRDAAWICVQGTWFDLSRRGPLRRVALALLEGAERGHTWTVAELLERGWPGERMLGDSGHARVYMAIRRLRSAILGPALRTLEGGYRLDSRYEVEWCDAPP
jgi:tetratricopeptide (TPR) repeat protein